MKIDTIISIGVVIYIIIALRKALSQGKKTEGNAKTPGWKQKLQDMATQIKDEIEKANQQMQVPVPPLPQNIPEDVDEDDEDNEENRLWDESEEEDEIDAPPDVPSRVISQSVFYETKTSRTPPPLSISGDDLDEEEDHRNRRNQLSEPVAPGSLCGRKKSVYRKFGKNELKRAVVWSEILAKPLALKDKQ